MASADDTVALRCYGRLTVVMHMAIAIARKVHRQSAEPEEQVVVGVASLWKISTQARRCTATRALKARLESHRCSAVS